MAYPCSCPSGHEQGFFYCPTGREVKVMKYLATEVVRTVRAAICGWPETIRLCLLVAVTTACIALVHTPI